MIAKTRGIIATLIALTFIPSVYAENLMQVYQQALQNDPTYQQAISTWQSAKEALPIARSYYLPTIFGEATYSQTDHTNHTDTSTQLASISQQIFNFSYWNGIKEANYSVKAATATYFSAQQSLMQRTAAAYFNVLTAGETVNYDKAYKRELYNQLVINQQKYKVGLISSVDVYTTEASYDTQVAQEISDKNTLRVNIEALAAITKQHYKSLQGIGSSVPLLSPKPNNIDQWVTTATKQNYALQGQQYTTLAAKKEIKVKAGGAMPYLYATASAAHDQSYSGSSSENYSTAGLTLDYYPFQGGLNYASTRQARYDYVTQTGVLEYNYRNTIQNTRTAFLGVSSDISKVKADKKGVLSAEKSLQATQAGYQVGTEDIEDVLSSISTLYLNKQANISDQYDYLNQLINLEQSAGTLSMNNLKTINGWLTKKVTFSTLLKDDNDTTASATVAAQPTKASRSTQHATKPVIQQTNTTAQTGNYTIQLYASHNVSDAKRYLQNMKNSNNANIIKSDRWYKVTYGDYQTLSNAKKALTQIQKLNRSAWIYHLPNHYTSVAKQNTKITAALQQPQPHAQSLQLPLPDA